MGCGCIIGSLACIAVLVAAGVCAWRFGPWYNASESDVASSPEDLAALNVCDGCCNLAKSNCDLKVNDVTFAMVHNAMSSRENLFAGYNNLKSMEGALVAGYRGLMLDSCICDGSIGETVQGILKGDGDKVCILYMIVICALIVDLCIFLSDLALLRRMVLCICVHLFFSLLFLLQIIG